MAGILTGANDLSVSNSGTASTAQRTVTIPSNTLGGEVLLAVVRSGRSSTGMTVGTPSGWTKLADAHFDSRLGAYIDGAVFFRVAAGTAGQASSDAGTSVQFTISVSSRMVVVVARTSGLDATALAAAAPMTPTETINSAANTTATAPSFTPATTPTLLLSMLAFNVTATQLPLAGMAAGSRDTGSYVNDPYNTGTGGSQAITALYLGWSDYTGTAASPNDSLTFPGGGSGVTGRALTFSLAMPVTTPSQAAGTGTSTGSASTRLAAAGVGTTSGTATVAVAAAGVGISPALAVVSVRAVGSATTAGAAATASTASGSGVSVAAVMVGARADGAAAAAATASLSPGAAGTGNAAGVASVRLLATGSAVSAGGARATGTAVGSGEAVGAAWIITVAAGVGDSAGSARPLTPANPVVVQMSLQPRALAVEIAPASITTALAPSRWKVTAT